MDDGLHKADVRKELIAKIIGNKAFWSYVHPQSEDISDEILIEKVLLHLDMDDIEKLFQLYPKPMIRKIWKDRLLSQEPMYHGLNRLYAFLYFDIKNPDRYIRDYRNKRNKSMICRE